LPPKTRAADPFSVPVDSRRQASSFPANFVHSLDASHMFATALECQKVSAGRPLSQSVSYSVSQSVCQSANYLLS
jgi:DNA-directed RNA polymerase